MKRGSLVEIITSPEAAVRNQSLDTLCREATADDLLHQCEALDRFRHESTNLYERVRALFFLYAIHRFHLPGKPGVPLKGQVPFKAYEALLQRRFEEALELCLAAQAGRGASDSLCSALAAAYHGLGFQTLADQVRQSVRSVRGNQWMFRIGHPADHPLRLHPQLLQRCEGLYPVLREATPVRMDLSHSGWSDIFFLGMDFPEGARVVNVSIDLSVRGSLPEQAPKPPVEGYLRVIDQPVLRLTSVDLQASAEISDLAEVFDYAKDYLGLLKAAVIASGLVPPGMEGTQQPLASLLTQVVGPGRGLELVSQVNGIPKGSRLAVSTSLLACLISVCMRATGQTANLTGALHEDERRQVAARAILGEWLAGSGGGWQDSGGLWPGVKLICGEPAREGDPEFGISRGRLLPGHHLFTDDEVSPEARQRLQDSLVLVHGGMAQDVGPILEMVTERYLLRSEAEWRDRQEAIRLLDEIVEHLKAGDICALGDATHRNFRGPIQTIIPWATNLYTETLIAQVQEEFGDDFWGFWMLGGMSGGGMGFIFAPAAKPAGQQRLQEIMSTAKRRLEHAVPFAMEPVVYDFAVNQRGTWAELSVGREALLPAGYYAQTVPVLVKQEARALTAVRRAELQTFAEACRTRPELSGMVETLFERMLPRQDEGDGSDHGQSLEQLLDAYGFDRVQHEQIRADLRSGRLGLAQNRLPVRTVIEDVLPDEVFDATGELPAGLREAGAAALKAGEVAVVSLAGGAGSRWTKGAGVVKALNPFCKLGGKQRSFIEVHLAKSRRTCRQFDAPLPHLFTTSYLTHEPLRAFLEEQDNFGYEAPLRLSPGRNIGLRLIPMVRDLRFAWEERPQQLLDEQAQKVRQSLHQALIGWAEAQGEGSDYTDNLPLQCLHPVGHWYEVPNLLQNGVLAELLRQQPSLRHLMLHNIDTVGAEVDPGLLGYHLQQEAAMTVEVITRRLEDRGGGLARLDGRPQLVEGLALPHEEVEFNLSYYNTLTCWIDLDRLLETFSLTRDQLTDPARVTAGVREVAAHMPTYITLKDVKKRWGKGQEDVFPVCQFEKLWGDMTALPGFDCRFAVVNRQRGQQLKEPAQLDGWLRDGSAAYVESLCDWAD